MDEILYEVDLDPAAPIRASLPEEKLRQSRLMETVRATYATTRRDAELARHFERLLTDLSERRDGEAPYARENRLEGNQITLIGESGAGKSSALKRLFRNHPAFPDYEKPRAKLVTVSAPSICNVMELGREIVSRLGYTINRTRVDAPEIWRQVRLRIRALGILVLHLDELQHVVQTVRGDDELQKVRNNLKALLVDTDHPIGLVIGGTHEVISLISSDRSVDRRGSWLEFQPLASPGDNRLVSGFIEALAHKAELSVEFGNSVATAFVPRLMHAGCYQLGIIAEEAHDAIRTALEEGVSVLTLEHFASAYAFRTGNFASWNPYLAEDWASVDAGRRLARREVSTTLTAAATRRSRGGKA